MHVLQRAEIERHCLPGLSGATAPVVPVWHDGHLIAELVAFDVTGRRWTGVRAGLLWGSASGGIERRMGF
ncbi:hypothetical protein OOU_Y34scaffold00177g2 [Pyricularia oryzae Y34]|uniref:Uncharacterized protein n=2 Tax=Pyricularia oryzae TaxID=318829 RepID=A0AA97PQ60_PYRO3|nr:hypothetical protein OOU_Y34scaffold00177g2 [Pyricularia oryzae Y34]KAI6312802.1 hypothetical protein MCOR30_010479 [Pyricularia oryzae]